MRTIYKYPIKVTDVQEVKMPFGAKIICAQLQNEVVTLWAECETFNSNTSRTIEIFGTGHQIDGQYSRTYVGTVQQGGFVWHVYERTT